MNRRRFLSQAGMLTAVCAAPAFARRSGRHFGIQLFSLPKMLQADFTGAIAFLAKLGYREIETFGPYTFSDPRAVARWKSLEPMLGFSGSGFFGQTLEQARSIFQAHHMSVPSMHTDWQTLQGQMGPLAEAAHKLGATYVTLPSIPGELRTTVDDYRRMADAFNKVGADALRNGVKFAYHNHGYGLKPVAGEVPLDILLKGTDAASVFFELDIYWTVAGGANPIDYLSRYSGRYKMLHLKDMKSIHYFSGDGGGPDQWTELFQYMTYLGDGAIDLQGILSVAEKSGVEHFFVEQDTVASPDVDLMQSANYLKNHGFK